MWKRERFISTCYANTDTNRTSFGVRPSSLTNRVLSNSEFKIDSRTVLLFFSVLQKRTVIVAGIYLRQYDDKPPPTVTRVTANPLPKQSHFIFAYFYLHRKTEVVFVSLAYLRSFVSDQKFFCVIFKIVCKISGRQGRIGDLSLLLLAVTLYRWMIRYLYCNFYDAMSIVLWKCFTKNGPAFELFLWFWFKIIRRKNLFKPIYFYRLYQ